MTINEFNSYFDVDLESDDVDTIAGYYLAGISNEAFNTKKICCFDK